MSIFMLHEFIMKLVLALVETFYHSATYATFWGFCGLIELSRKLFFFFCSIIFSHLSLSQYLFFASTYEKNIVVAENVMWRTKCKRAELVAQFKWVHWLDAASFFSYTRLLMWLARINKEKNRLYRKKSTDERMSRQSATRKKIESVLCDIKVFFSSFSGHLARKQMKRARAINLFKVFHRDSRKIQTFLCINLLKYFLDIAFHVCSSLSCFSAEKLLLNKCFDFSH